MLSQGAEQRQKSIKRVSAIVVEPFNFDIEQMCLIEIIEKYLSENRWNNIVHIIL